MRINGASGRVRSMIAIVVDLPTAAERSNPEYESLGSCVCSVVRYPATQLLIVTFCVM